MLVITGCYTAYTVYAPAYFAISHAPVGNGSDGLQTMAAPIVNFCLKSSLSSTVNLGCDVDHEAAIRQATPDHISRAYVHSESARAPIAAD